jgi:hypothetical protein
MNSAIEFHDSEVAAIVLDGDSVIVSFKEAYVHKSLGTPAVDPGTGWTQAARLFIGGASIEGVFPDFPCWIADGSLRIEGRDSDELIPIPLDRIGSVRLEILFHKDSHVVIVGNSAKLVLIGDPTYVEEYHDRHLTKPCS